MIQIIKNTISPPGFGIMGFYFQSFVEWICRPGRVAAKLLKLLHPLRSRLDWFLDYVLNFVGIIKSVQSLIE